jgi:hypothetical protein
MNRFDAVLVTDDASTPVPETSRKNPTSFTFPDSPTLTKNNKTGRRGSISVTSALSGNVPTAASLLLSNGVLIGSTPKSNQAKFDQMMEAQMISDILRANTSLRQFKAFRVANEKLYKDKQLAELRSKEIKEPLEAALVENEILTGKLARRDELIALLRKQIYNEVIHSMQQQQMQQLKSPSVLSHTDEFRLQHLHELHASEELKTEELMDKIESFKPVLLSQQQQITKLKQLIASQAEKIRHLFDEIDKMEIFQKDQKRIFDTDKETFATMLEARENKIEMLLEERSDLQENLQETKQELTTKRAEVTMLTVQNADLTEQVVYWKESATKFQDSMKVQSLQCAQISEEQVLLQERHADLQARYDSLVVELDQMVEEGYYIPSGAEALALMQSAQSNAVAAKKKSRKGSKGNNKGKSRKVSTVGSVASTKSHSKNAQTKSRLTSQSSSVMNIMSASTVSSHEAFNDEDCDFEDNEIDDNDTDNNHDNNAEDDDTEDHPQRKRSSKGSHPSQHAGRFSLRKAEEDELIAERMQYHAAMRQKEALLTQIATLERQCGEEKIRGVEATKKMLVIQENLVTNQKLYVIEVTNLQAKVKSLELENAELKDEVQVFKTTNTIIQNQLNSFPINASTGASPRKGISLFQRISMMLMAPPDAGDTALESTLEQFVDQVSPDLSPDQKAQRRHKRRQFFDDIQGLMHLQRPLGHGAAGAGREGDNQEDTSTMEEKVYTTEQWEARTRRLGRWQSRRRARRREIWSQEQQSKQEEAFWQGIEFVPDENYTSDDEQADDPDNYDSELDSGYNSEADRAKEQDEQAQALALKQRQEEEDAEQQKVDLMHYMFAWENVHQNSQTTQCGPGFDPEEVTNAKVRNSVIQFDRDDFFEYLEAQRVLFGPSEDDAEAAENEQNRGEDEGSREGEEDEEGVQEYEDEEEEGEDVFAAFQDGTLTVEEEEDEAMEQTGIEGEIPQPLSANSSPLSRKSSTKSSLSRPNSFRRTTSSNSRQNSFDNTNGISRRDTGRPAVSSLLDDSDLSAGNSPTGSPLQQRRKLHAHPQHQSRNAAGIGATPTNTQAEQDAYVRFKQVYGSQVADLYQGLRMIVQQHFPKHKLAMFELDPSHPETWQAELVAQDLLVGLDIEWQVKHALVFLTACNQLRNQFLGSFMKEIEAQERAKHAREQRLLHEKEAMSRENQRLRQQLSSKLQDHDKSDSGIEIIDEKRPLLRPFIQKHKDEKLLGNPYFEEDYQANCKILMLVRCLDVIVQSMHHLLSPIYHLQHSEYPELQRLYPLDGQTRLNLSELAAPAAGPSRQSSPSARRSRPSSQQQRHVSSTNTSGTRRQSYDDTFRDDHGQRPLTAPMVSASMLPSTALHPDYHSTATAARESLFATFRLTETQLTSDVPRGAPKGTLRHDTYTSLQREHHYATHFHHQQHQQQPQQVQSSVPRQFPKHIDQILDLLERHSRASSPAARIGSGDGGNVRRVQAPATAATTLAVAVAAAANTVTSATSPTAAAAIREVGMQEQILEEYRNQLAQQQLHHQNAPVAVSNLTVLSTEPVTKGLLALESEDEEKEEGSEPSSEVNQKNSLKHSRTKKSSKHIERIVPRAASDLSRQQQQLQSQSQQASLVQESLIPEESASLAQLSEDELGHLPLVANSATSATSNVDAPVGQRAISPPSKVSFANNPYHHPQSHSGHKHNSTQASSAAVVSMLHNPLFGTHTMRPFSSPNRNHINANSNNKKKQDTSEVLEYLDYTRYVFQSKDPAVSVYNHMYSNQQRARTASYHYLQQEGQQPPSSQKSNKPLHQHSSSIGMEDAQEFLRSMSPAHQDRSSNPVSQQGLLPQQQQQNGAYVVHLNQPGMQKLDLVSAFAASQVSSSVAGSFTSSPMIAPAPSTVTGATAVGGTGSKSYGSHNRGNKAPTSVLTAGRRLRSASPPPLSHHHHPYPQMSAASSLSLASSVAFAAPPTDMSPGAMATGITLHNHSKAAFPPVIASTANNNQVESQQSQFPRPATTTSASAAFSPRPPSTQKPSSAAGHTAAVTGMNPSKRPATLATSSASTARPTTQPNGHRQAAPVDAQLLNTAITGARLLTNIPAPPTASPFTAAATSSKPGRKQAVTASSGGANPSSNNKESQFYAPRIDRSYLQHPPAASTVSNSLQPGSNPIVNDNQATPLEDQSLTVDILHDVRFFPPPSQPLPPAYHTQQQQAAMDVRLTGGIIGMRPLLSTGNTTNSLEELESEYNADTTNDVDDHNHSANPLLWVAGNKTKPSSVKERVTGASLFM